MPEFLGLFKGKTTSRVDPTVGAPIVRRTALPAAFTTPPAPAYPPVRHLGGDALPPAGRLAPNDWSQGLPFRFVDTLQVTADAVLVLFHSDKERLGPQRYANRTDHLVLFSSAHRDGVAVLTLGIDDGNVRQWGLVGKTLRLKTSDDRGAKPREAIWSLDLAKLL